jgi:hypothetical protein
MLVNVIIFKNKARFKQCQVLYAPLASIRIHVTSFSRVTRQETGRRFVRLPTCLDECILQVVQTDKKDSPGPHSISIGSFLSETKLMERQSNNLPTFNAEVKRVDLNIFFSPTPAWLSQGHLYPFPYFILHLMLLSAYIKQSVSPKKGLA